LLLESWSVREAARMGGTSHLATATALLDAMEDRTVTTADFLLLDAQFHVTLALATGNAVVAAIMTSLRDAIGSYVLRSASVLPDWPSMAKKLRREHRAILAAVTAGDGELAARRVARHIEGFYRATQVG
jgi:GntR family transcriptional regulator, transcriptional repressor for pyruvate dehydrogenase complex